MEHKLYDLRQEYKKGTLDEKEVDKNPITQFEKWFEEAVKSNIPEVTAMTLATADKQGRPSARTVLLKEFDERGFIFFSNYDSNKAKDLKENPQAALLFFWEPLERQVRITGRVEKISLKESLEYFHSRPMESQLGAWASMQSSVVSARDVLEMTFASMKKKFQNGQIPLPPFWGGYRVIPEEFEYWQGRPNRLHDRVWYKQENGNWKIARLSP
ncbi:MAG: pyridoxamine 5'-phosphate oxidase [Bacteroidota bacterium]|nr:pyridoxamine 5'-phosphate oxidase [Bacteroidota bacterium]